MELKYFIKSRSENLDKKILVFLEDGFGMTKFSGITKGVVKI
jgi:hypothetical protein